MAINVPNACRNDEKMRTGIYVEESTSHTVAPIIGLKRRELRKTEPNIILFIASSSDENYVNFDNQDRTGRTSICMPPLRSEIFMNNLLLFNQ